MLRASLLYTMFWKHNLKEACLIWRPSTSSVREMKISNATIEDEIKNLKIDMEERDPKRINQLLQVGPIAQ